MDKVKLRHKELWGRIRLLDLYYFYKKIFFVKPSQYLFSFIYYLSFKPIRCCDISCGIRYLGENRTVLPHPVGIVIGKNVILAKNVRIYQNVTIGAKSINDLRYPVIGENVIISANAIVIGNIKIGDNSIIGAGAVVLKDVPSDSIVVGNPARIIRKGYE
ncbi:serine O-acetyltransferase [Parabacteroides sp. PF5-5]|uniref:serine O-acetyltransferase n=1 Tax=unclassified Parabacteroides TaxID=2649774 RepID=UPI002476384A|nr:MULTISPECIES: DapH/DapD/GlmU-related protein [unclassified Parabacteroides]MDH6316374.1 serine O-acetyltransferase [Parabacteroides sp. PF5-13]MDH6327561.1 serine O-acetyltransferase [Parabacteroides sp. PH5-41]MDH6335299.1 serine O-acetyltransferase [Parabacteroides sp. PF5-5]MDH6346362.1 serine O-acetyltransferase [Parabacteroides sp. PH5-46]MDH6361387.1 serine O-acetyltransferase [Parabacteroides sp. PH5-16]